MFKRLKVKLYPSKKQVEMLEQHFDGYRFAYNLCIEYKQYLYKHYKKNITAYEMQNELTEIRKESDWLIKCKAECIGYAALVADNSFKNFFKGAGFPKFKSKRGEQSFSAHQAIHCKNTKVSFFGNKINFKTSEKYLDILKNNKLKKVTFKRDSCGDYWATFLVDIENTKTLSISTNSVGVDLGIKELVTTSDGEYFENKKLLQDNYYKLRRLQRRFAKTKRGGKNREKLRIKIAKLHRKITRQREHYYHQITNKLLSENQTIVVETLQVKKMLGEKKLSKQISDASWGLLLEMLEYKAKWYGREIIKINKYFPSSKTCSNCGNIKEDLKLSDRVYKCNVCNHEMDRDLNAAINILKEGLK